MDFGCGWAALEILFILSNYVFCRENFRLRRALRLSKMRRVCDRRFG
jgi:peptidoglycan/LPS O-acetylase OafA/YrhL